MAASGSLPPEDKKHSPSGGLGAIPSAQMQSKEAQPLTTSSSDGPPSRRFKHQHQGHTLLVYPMLF